MSARRHRAKEMMNGSWTIRHRIFGVWFPVPPAILGHSRSWIVWNKVPRKLKKQLKYCRILVSGPGRYTVWEAIRGEEAETKAQEVEAALANRRPS